MEYAHWWWYGDGIPERIYTVLTLGRLSRRTHILKGL